MPYEFAYILAAVNHSTKVWTRRTDFNVFVAYAETSSRRWSRITNYDPAFGRERFGEWPPLGFI